MATVFPTDDSVLSGLPFSLQEYYASCHRNKSLTLLFLPISRHSKNILHSARHSASISITSTIPAAIHARVALIGNVAIFRNTEHVPELGKIRGCYLDKHPDAKWWLPDGDDAAHTVYWGRFDPHSIYFVGGFGDEHYIGFIPPKIYKETIPGRNSVNVQDNDLDMTPFN